MAFGWLGDKVGRRFSLIASITLMGGAATLIGLLPGYAQIGVWAPILLVVLRMLQGFSAGGEIDGAASYIREWAPPKRRALYISFLPSIAQFGQGLAAAIAGLAAATLTDPEMLSPKVKA
ncbi:MFS transporter [Pseudomonas viridiflava]|uniref:MFS transporter n=1 Tax=Pseudomonas viridiflava TaxID=33069 RepID=UPI0023F6FB84|nr:MFS transporter [Pseudomonas viridiflava]